ncbi:MAG: DUF547 domain-containing protein [Acidobacteriota bacterium]
MGAARWHRIIAAKSGILLLLIVLQACTEQRVASAVDSVTTNLKAPDQEAYRAVLSERVNSEGQVDYRGLKADRHELDRYVRSLSGLDPKSYAAWTNPEKIAFWVNAYNGLTLKIVVDHYPIRKGGLISSLRFPESSIRQIPGVWDEITNAVMGNPMTLDQIEHEILRKEFSEPRIHMALVCAAMGCPPLRSEPYSGVRLDGQLNDQARRLFSDPRKFRIDRNNETVYLSSIFKWFGSDFGRAYATGEFQQVSSDLRPVLNFAARHVSAADGQYLKNQRYAVEYLDYDWSLNEEK